MKMTMEEFAKKYRINMTEEMLDDLKKVAYHYSCMGIDLTVARAREEAEKWL